METRLITGLPIAIPIPAPSYIYAHPESDPFYHTGEPVKCPLIVPGYPIFEAWGNVNCPTWCLVMLAIGPLQLALAGTKGFLLSRLPAVTLNDGTIDVLDNLIEKHLESLITACEVFGAGGGEAWHINSP